MAAIYNEQRVLGIRLQPDGAIMFNNQPVIGIREAADGVLFTDNLRVLGVDVLDVDQAIYNDQPVRGAVLIEDDRTMYNGMRVTPSKGGGLPTGFAFLTDENGNYLTDENGERLIGDVTNSSASLRQVAASRGILLGTSIQSPDDMGAPGPSGYATRMDWIRGNFDLYVPGYVMQPDYIEASPGVYGTADAEAFIADALSSGKSFRGHVAFYPKRQAGTWVDTTINSGNWETFLDNYLTALCSVPGMDQASNFDAVNELLSASSGNPGGWRTNAWNAAAGSYTAPPLFVFQRLRELLPSVPLYWCQDQTEQQGQSVHQMLATNTLNAIESVMALGADVSGFAMQCHLSNRLGFNATLLRNFCRDLRENLGLDIIISELDCRTGYLTSSNHDTLPPSGFKTADAYDQQNAYLQERLIDIVGPYVKDAGKQILLWTADDGYNSWTPEIDSENPSGERPCAWDSTFQPKAQHRAIRRAIQRL